LSLIVPPKEQRSRRGYSSGGNKIPRFSPPPPTSPQIHNFSFPCQIGPNKFYGVVSVPPPRKLSVSNYDCLRPLELRRNLHSPLPFFPPGFALHGRSVSFFFNSPLVDPPFRFKRGGRFSCAPTFSPLTLRPDYLILAVFQCNPVSTHRCFPFFSIKFFLMSTKRILTPRTPPRAHTPLPLAPYGICPGFFFPVYPQVANALQGSSSGAQPRSTSSLWLGSTQVSFCLTVACCPFRQNLPFFFFSPTPQYWSRHPVLLCCLTGPPISCGFFSTSNESQRTPPISPHPWRALVTTHGTNPLFPRLFFPLRALSPPPPRPPCF